MAREDYAEQVRLLFTVIPAINREECFALKGGTAINLFYRDLPRLSVDIDLTYLPVQPRDESLLGIDSAMNRIREHCERMPETSCHRIRGGGGNQTRALVTRGRTSVKIETSPVTRGVVFDTQEMRVQPAVEKEFGFAETTLASFEDVYGGKLHAALDRQHPRDIFDVQLLYDNEGLTDRLFQVLLVYLSCSSRPIHELLNPNLIEIGDMYEREFAGMVVEADEPSLDDLLETRQMFFDDVRSRLVDEVADYLISLQQGSPDFGLLGLPQDLEQLPAIQWKLININRLIDENPKKHKLQTEELEALLL